MEKMSVNQFIAHNLNTLANMSITKLKALLLKLKKSRNADDKKTVQIIRAIIEKKKSEYPIVAAAKRSAQPGQVGELAMRHHQPRFLA